MFHHKNAQITAGISIAAIIAIINSLGYYNTDLGSSINTFFFALGGMMPDGLIQFATFACFFICMFGLQAHLRVIQREGSMLNAKLLPETEQYVLYAEDVNRVKLEVIEAERKFGPGMLTDLIKQATTKFRSSHSSSESLAMVETVSTMHRQSLEKDMWLISTCQMLIPAFGFLGTVWGMAAAILSMGQQNTATASTNATSSALNAADIQALISNLGTAFFTTIVSIVLGIIVNVMMKRAESQTDEVLTSMKRYVVENLVNRVQE